MAFRVSDRYSPGLIKILFRLRVSKLAENEDGTYHWYFRTLDTAGRITVTLVGDGSLLYLVASVGSASDLTTVHHIVLIISMTGDDQDSRFQTGILLHDHLDVSSSTSTNIHLPDKGAFPREFGS
jgi:hypothetical protein